MKPFSRHLIATLGVSAMALLPATGGVFLLSADQALADLQDELDAITTYRDAETLLAEAEAAEGDSYNNLVSDTLSEEAWTEFLSLLGLDPETEQPEIAIGETTEGDGEATE